MEVEIIEIKKELIDWPIDRGNTMERAIMNPMRFDAILREGSAPPDTHIDMRKERFEIKKIVNPDGKYQYFFVKTDDRKLFDQLIIITNDTISKLVAQRTRELEEKASSAKYREFRRIADLPWWKRLFKKF